MITYAYPVVIEPDEFEDGRQAFAASCPALPGCATYGTTYEEALANVREAVELFVDTLLATDGQLPRGVVAELGTTVELVIRGKVSS